MHLWEYFEHKAKWTKQSIITNNKILFLEYFWEQKFSKVQTLATWVMLLFMLLDKRQTFLGTVKDNGSHLLECNLKNLKRQAYYHIKRDKKSKFSNFEEKITHGSPPVGPPWSRVQSNSVWLGIVCIIELKFEHFSKIKSYLAISFFFVSQPRLGRKPRPRWACWEEYWFK